MRGGAAALTTASRRVSPDVGNGRGVSIVAGEFSCPLRSTFTSTSSAHTLLILRASPCRVWRPSTVASISYRPVGRLDLMKIVGNRPTTLECKNRGVYAMADLQRWAMNYQVGVAPSPFWQTIHFGAFGGGSLAALDEARGPNTSTPSTPLSMAWPVDLGQRCELIRVLDKAGFDGVRLRERAKSVEYAARLERSTTAAAQRGVFGSPTTFVGGDVLRQRSARLPGRGTSVRTMRFLPRCPLCLRSRGIEQVVPQRNARSGLRR
jgi:2-hydroxychromene-2-carboxylate isomerase